MKDRITEFLVKENISPAEFADKIGVQRSSVSHVLNGRNYPGASFLQKMLSSYKSLNPRWLLLGEGLMLETKRTISEPSLFSSSSIEKEEHIPLKNSEVKVNEDIFSVADKIDLKNETNLLKNNIRDSKQEIDQSKQEINQLINEISDSKEIIKIVLFYVDKTFKVYTASK